jgi:hypothetical protein
VQVNAGHEFGPYSIITKPERVQARNPHISGLIRTAPPIHSLARSPKVLQP